MRGSKDMAQHNVVVPDRRTFLKLGLAATASLITAPALATVSAQPERRLAFYNTHTDERLDTVYWTDGGYVESSLQEINRLLRDHRADEVHAMSRQLLDLLFLLQTRTGVHKPYDVISGYRSPATNSALRKHSSGVARRSYHMQGMAIDIRLPGCDLKHLYQAALSAEAGGVGYYPGSDFIHVDTGPVRNW